jgi:hypothetical protein
VALLAGAGRWLTVLLLAEGGLGLHKGLHAMLPAVCARLAFREHF